MKNFKNFYIWVANTKLYMGLYFAGIVITVGFVNFIFKDKSIEYITLIQILLVSALMALSQVILLPDDTDFSKKILFPKSLLWIVWSFIVVVIASYIGNWFNGLPIWVSFAYAFIWVIGCVCMLLFLSFEQQMDTEILNKSLKRFKKSCEQEKKGE